MKYILITLISLFFSFISFAHAFYFAFAEMEFNYASNKFEISVRATGHDVEAYLEHLKSPISSLEEAKNNPLELKKLEQLITSEFTLKIEDKQLKLTLLGIEISKNDEVVFYLESNPVSPPKKIEVNFFLLMNLFPEQQNKLTFISPTEKTYYSFLNHKRNRTILLKP